MNQEPKKVSISDIVKNSKVKPVIYKYRDWKDSDQKKLLTENTLYLASPKDFNDPFDCRINKNFTLLSKEEKDQFITDLAIKNFEETVAKGNDFEFLIRDLERRMENLEEIQELSDKNLFSMQDDYYAIFSCSEIWNNILMWSHYANNHKGMCVGLNTKKLLEGGIIGKYGKVNYRKTFPKRKPKVMMTQEDWDYSESFIETHTKGHEWNYEREVRFMTTSLNPLTLKDRLIPITDDYFSNITLGLWISEADKEEILKICKEKKIIVYQAVKKDFKFEIKRKRIL